MHHHAQLLVKKGFHFLPRLALNCDPPDLSLLRSQDYRFFNIIILLCAQMGKPLESGSRIKPAR
jgi:hypothetical protein